MSAHPKDRVRRRPGKLSKLTKNVSVKLEALRIKWWQRFNLERRENHVQPEKRQHRPANQRSESGPFRDDDVADDEANKRQNHMKKQ